jgi:hypothetical protein
VVRSPRAGNFPSFIPPSLLFRCDGAVHLSAYCARSDLWDDNSGQLAFANMEDIAKTATPVNDLGQLNPYHVDAALLHQQEAHLSLGVGELRRSRQSGENRAWSARQAFSDPTPATQTLDFKADVGAMFGGH